MKEARAAFTTPGSSSEEGIIMKVKCLSKAKSQCNKKGSGIYHSLGQRGGLNEVKLIISYYKYLTVL
jgi:hypothetical protein